LIYVIIVCLGLGLLVGVLYVALDGHIFWNKVSASAPTEFPYVLETRLVPTTGAKQWVRVEVYQNTVQIVGGRPKGILALIRIEDVIRVSHQNRSADGLPMAGLSLVTKGGQYMFWSEGFNAPNKMKRTAFVIRAVAGDRIQVRDLDTTRLTPDNIVHNG
jgi:hypothetical protein